MAEQDRFRVDADKCDETVAGEPSLVTNNFNAPIDISVRVEINFPPITGERPTSPLEVFLGRDPFGGDVRMPPFLADLVEMMGGSRSQRNCGNPACPVCSSDTQSTVSDTEAAVAGVEDPVV